MKSQIYAFTQYGVNSLGGGGKCHPKSSEEAVELLGLTRRCGATHSQADFVYFHPLR